MMRRFISIIFLSLIMALPVQAETYERLVQIIIDDTGALQDELDPESKSSARETVLNYLSSVSSRYGRETLVIVASQYSASNVWSGEARMIRRSSQNVGLQRFLQSRWGGCSDIIRVFQLLEDNIYLYPADEHEVIFFSSLVHTGDPCSATAYNPNVTIPEEFLEKLRDFVARYTPTLAFYWIFDSGRGSIREQLVQFSRDNQIDFLIKSESETRSERF